jgi:hypothetical protein
MSFRLIVLSTGGPLYPGGTADKLQADISERKKKKRKEEAAKPEASFATS